MNYFHYIVANKEIQEYKGEIKALPIGFLECEATLMGESVYYKTVNEKITEVIGEAIHEQAARRRVEEFLSTFLMTPFEAL